LVDREGEDDVGPNYSRLTPFHLRR
jgi:hypothetical protein